MDSYQSVAQFLDEVADFARQVTNVYVKRTMRMGETGAVGMRGRILSATDLAGAFEDRFLTQEVLEYDTMQEESRRQMEIMKQKCRNSAAKKTIIPLVYLIYRFRCNEFETFLLFLLLAAECDEYFSKTYQILMGDQSALTPSFHMCLLLYTFDSRRQKEILAQERARERLLGLFVDFGKAGQRDSYTDITRPLHFHSDILDFCFDMNRENAKISHYAVMIWPWLAKDERLLAGQDVLKRLLLYVQNEKKEKKRICLCGSAGSGRHFMLRQFAMHTKKNILLVNMKHFDDERAFFEEKYEELKRECLVRDAVLAFEHISADRLNLIEDVCGQAWEFSDVIFFLADADQSDLRINPFRDQMLIVDLDNRKPEEKLSVWEYYLEQSGIFSKDLAQRMLSKFDFTPGRIEKSVRHAGMLMQWEGDTGTDERLLTKACYQLVGHQLSDKAVRIRTYDTWDDLILEDSQKDLLRAACDRIRYKHKVYYQWNFISKQSYGRGVSMLFYGPPGTGKTMTAGVIANELDMELYKVDLSTVMSKYIGESEKSLRVIFDEAKKSNSILFFDEADALFGKRTETKESNDKYANAETSYLLQKMEEYEGIVILATNYIQNFDEAYKRRVKYMIHFPFPDEKHRIALWKSIFPKDAPRGEIDYEYLAGNFELSGSYIKNIVTNAAFMAAAAGEDIQMKHIMVSLKREMEKYGKVLSSAELGEYYYLLV